VIPSVPPSQTTFVQARHALIVAPHYDDEVLGCGGLVNQLAAAGTRVDVIFLSDGAGAPGDASDGGAAAGDFRFADAVAYAQRRREESDEAARVLGIAERVHVGLPDNSLALPAHVAAASRAIEARIRESSPDLLLAPSPSEISADHRAACAAVHEAIQRLRSTHEDLIRGLDVLLYEVNHASHPDLLVDVSTQVPILTAAMQRYASQQARHDYLAAALGLRRFRTLTLAPGVTHAEGYRRLSGWDLATRSFAQVIALAGGVHAPETIVTGPLVSVVVRTQDRPQFLGDALASLAGSTYRQVEVILVNDGGAPPAAPADYPFSIVRVEHAQPRGRGAAAQAGVDASHGPLIAFLDDDDIVAPEHLATLVGAMHATQAQVVYSVAAVAVHVLDVDAGWRCVSRETPYGRDFDPDRLLVDNYIPLNTLLIDKALLTAAGPFDASLEIFEDWDMLIRLAALTRFHHEPRVTCEYRQFRGVQGQALGEDGWRRPDFVELKARVLARHASRLTPAALARAIVGLRADTTAAEQSRRQAVGAAETESKELRRVLNHASSELHRVYGEEARLTAATHDLEQRIAALLTPAAPIDEPADQLAEEPASEPASEATSETVNEPASEAVSEPPPIDVRRSETPIRKASVLLLSWNGRAHLETCLDALARQQAPGIPWDCWVLDNGSTDGSVDWLRTQHPDVRVVSSPVNLGFCAGYNRLVAATDADLLLFLNNDALPAPDWVAELIAAITDAPADVAAAAGLMVDWSGERLDFGRGVMTFDGHAFQLDSGRPLGSVTLPSPGEEQLFACGANMIVRRESFLAAGGFDEQFFAYYDDVDLGWRLWSGGERILSAPRAVVRHRSAGTSDRLGMYNRGFLFERNAFLTAYKNYDGPLWEKLMPALMLTLVSRTTAFLTQNNPHGAALAVDPFAAPGAAGAQSAQGATTNGHGAGAGSGAARRWLSRRTVAAPQHPILSDPLTVAQLRALAWLTRNMDAAAERRRRVQERRRRSDLDIFAAFPLHLVPTYAGDDVLFNSPGFQAWLPDTPKLVFRTLDEISART
jgi:GT2 family glycosyltransferase/LmbE family N-acetylglucosaminyl deacetylase